VVVATPLCLPSSLSKFLIHILNKENCIYLILFILIKRLFKETPRIQKFFAKFANVAVESLPGNAEYEKQVTLVADRLYAMISAMDDKLQLLGNVKYMLYTDTSRSIPRGPSFSQHTNWFNSNALAKVCFI
jgi:hypothetical protein